MGPEETMQQMLGWDSTKRRFQINEDRAWLGCCYSFPKPDATFGNGLFHATSR
jgi:hypothetical protein